MQRALPETAVDPTLGRAISELGASFPSIEAAEMAALSSDIAEPLVADRRWAAFCEQVTLSIAARGYIVVRGLDADHGRSLLLVSRALGATFCTYGRRRVVKRFRMSPWTTELSHTIRAGDFHTDANVTAVPPGATAMQCEHEDPGAPEFAEQRVAYLPDLLERLATGSAEDANAFVYLTEAVAELARENSAEQWRGRLVANGKIRYHPHSLRVAQRRRGGDCSKVESVIAAVHRGALDVSIPFHTSPGDTVLVSNRTALHYRGACSVRFTRFPTQFEARSMFVLHMQESSASG